MKILLLVCLLTVTACGKKDSSTSSSTSTDKTTQPGVESVLPSSTAGENFGCSHKTCDSATEFCLKITKNETLKSVDCVPRTPAVTDCDSALAETKKKISPANYCSNFISCQSRQSIVVLTCYIP